MPRKTHHSAVAVVPPADVWEPIQTIRRRHDRHFQRWMPHINLLYPFVPHAQFAEVLPVLSAASQSVTAFSITLAEFRFFRHSSGSSTVWLRPEPHAALGHLQETLQAALPICNDLSQFAGGFTPHLSVGQVRSAAERQALIEECQAHWRPLTFCLEAIALIWREAESPFQVAHWCPLRQV
jgi:RNA 2',3'-cyclic 3'-phosphodiesterase